MFQTESRPESWGANPFFVLLSVASSDLSQSFPNPNCAQYLAWVSQNITGEEAVTREKWKWYCCFVLHESSIPCPPCVWQSDCLQSTRKLWADSPRVVIPLIRGSLHDDSSLRSLSLSPRLKRTVHDSRVCQYFEYHFTLTVLNIRWARENKMDKTCQM